MVPRAPGARRTFSGWCRYTGDCGRRPGRRTAAAPRRQLVALAGRTITRRRNGPARRSRLHPHYAAQRWHATGEPPAVARDRGRAPSMDNPPACIPRSLTSVAACHRILLQPLALPVLSTRRPPHVEVLSRHVPTGRLWAPCTRLCASASPSAVLLPGARHPALCSAPRCEFLAAATTRPRPCRSWLPWWRMRWRRGIK